MSFIAEQIVEEWITRQGYFTIRGLKMGNDEMDLLAVKCLSNGRWDNIHIEVQVSIKPVSYISGLTLKRQNEFKIQGARNATTRTTDQLKIAVSDWVQKKYFDQRKTKMRNNLINSDNWRFLFVHGIVKKEQELSFIKEHNIETKFISEILDDLQKPNLKFKTRSATDIIEIIELINKQIQK